MFFSFRTFQKDAQLEIMRDEFPGKALSIEGRFIWRKHQRTLRLQLCVMKLFIANLNLNIN